MNSLFEEWCHRNKLSTEKYPGEDRYVVHEVQVAWLAVQSIYPTAYQDGWNNGARYARERERV